MRLCIRISLILLVLPYSVFSQAFTLEKGQSGAALVYTYAEADDGSLQTGSFINTIRGVFDIGVSVGTINPDGFGDNLSLIAAQVEAYPLREGEMGGFPISASLFGFWTNTGPNNTNGYGFGGTVFKKLRLGKGAYISPIFNLAKLWPLGSDYDSETAVEIDLPLVLILSPKLRASIAFSVVNSDSQDAKGIAFGLTFSGINKPKKRG